MALLKKSLKVKIPENIVVLYSPEKNLLLLTNGTRIKTVRLGFKLVILKTFSNQKFLYVTDVLAKKGVSSYFLKKLPGLQGATVSIIKSAILEVNYTLYKKLKLVGVGYRIFLSNSVGKNAAIDKSFKTKLGHNHFIYYKLPDNLKMYCIKYVYATMFGPVSYQHLTQTIAKLRSLRPPEPYKGKGVLFLGEVVDLKQGKRV